MIVAVDEGGVEDSSAVRKQSKRLNTMSSNLQIFSRGRFIVSI